MASTSRIANNLTRLSRLLSGPSSGLLSCSYSGFVPVANLSVLSGSNPYAIRGPKPYVISGADHQPLLGFHRSVLSGLHKPQHCTFSTSSFLFSPEEPSQQDPEDEEKLTLYQRFKQTYKTHGKILVVVHACTSVCWFGGFYGLVNAGVDVIGILEWLNVSEKLLAPVRSSAWVDMALAYLMYKLASPLRYMVTIGGTRLVVSQFRRSGRMPEVREEDRLRNLAKESQASIKELAKDSRKDLSERYQQGRDSLRSATRRRRARRKNRNRDP